MILLYVLKLITESCQITMKSLFTFDLVPRQHCCLSSTDKAY